MTLNRSSGLLLHVTSLPGKYGIGTLGRGAYDFVDLLAAGGQTYWQILPLGPINSGSGWSPYSSSSTFAGNWLLIDLEALQKEEWLKGDLLKDVPVMDEAAFVDYGAVAHYKLPALRRAAADFFARADPDSRGAFVNFCREEKYWLDDYALFAALAAYFRTCDWSQWEKGAAGREPHAMVQWANKLADQIDFCKFVQFVFFKQWHELKAYCHKRGVSIIGDLPIYVDVGSADTWSRPGIFRLDPQTLRPTVVAGVPPDYFSSTGQLWGNPLYRWFQDDVLKPDTAAWWGSRLGHVLKQVDLVRLDHFQGFETFWAVAATEKTAIKGTWGKGPGLALFEYLQEKIGPLPLIVEDLGNITREVAALKERLGAPGMKVLQYGFDGNPKNPELPAAYTDDNCVVYTGTHDNNTSLGWFREEINSEQRVYVRQYLGVGDESEFLPRFIGLALASRARLAIIPYQDILGLDSKHRMNMPGQAYGNWTPKLTPGSLTTRHMEDLKALCRACGRS